MSKNLQYLKFTAHFKPNILINSYSLIVLHCLLQDQLSETVLTLGRVLSLYWLAILIVQAMKKQFFSALPNPLELFLAITTMLLVLNVLVSVRA